MGIIRLLAVAAVAVLTGCASAPRQTVELSQAINEQIASMQTSHESFVRLYYRGLRREVDDFMARQWTPRFISNVITGKGAEGKRFRAELDRGYALLNVDWKRAVRIDGIDDDKTRAALQAAIDDVEVRSHGELGRVLIDFSNAAQDQIERQRRKLLQPIDEQEALVLDELRKGYADLLAGTSAIKGYLASVVNVTERQEAVAQKLGVLEKQRELVGSAIQLNESVISKLLDGKDDVDEQADAIRKWLREAREKLKKL